MRGFYFGIALMNNLTLSIDIKSFDVMNELDISRPRTADGKVIRSEHQQGSEKTAKY